MSIEGRNPAFGTFVGELPLVSTVRIAAVAGAEFIVFDGEHGLIELGDLRPAIAMCISLGIDAIVRIPGVESLLLGQALDSGARGILAPNVETREQALRLAERSFFPPMGRRGASFGSLQDGYSGGSLADKIEQANKTTLVICMIESPLGADNVEEIVSVPGIAGCWFGYIDFSVFAGIPGQIEHPLVIDAASRVGAACSKRSKMAGVMTTSAGHLAPYFSRQFNLFAWGSDSFVLREGMRSGIDLCRETLHAACSPVDKRKET
jgi:2-keto-3-deoxy-L-rhamnonate aldolase RhmA